MRKWIGRAIAVAAAAAAALAASRRNARDRPSPHGEQSWHAVTMNVRPDEVSPEGRLPEPLAVLGDTVEVEHHPAPGERGTEVRVRLRGKGTDGLRGSAGTDRQPDLRRAMRDAKQLLETGEVLHGPEPATSRTTLRNAPLRLAERRAKREGLL